MAGRNGMRESMVKGLSIERREIERPPCPECGIAKPISHGSSWTCSNRTCGKTWQKVFRGRAHKNILDRPEQCPYCGLKHFIWANGERWWCRSCGKSWGKDKGKHSKRHDMGDRPACPKCTTPNPASSGIRWQCINPNCGISWYKVYRTPQVLKPVDLIGAKIINA